MKIPCPYCTEKRWRTKSLNEHIEQAHADKLKTTPKPDGLIPSRVPDYKAVQDSADVSHYAKQSTSGASAIRGESVQYGSPLDNVGPAAGDYNFDGVPDILEPEMPGTLYNELSNLSNDDDAVRVDELPEDDVVNEIHTAPEPETEIDKQYDNTPSYEPSYDPPASSNDDTASNNDTSYGNDTSDYGSNNDFSTDNN